MSEYSKSLKRIVKILAKGEKDYDKSDYDSILLEVPDLKDHEKLLDFIKVIVSSSEENCISALESAEYLMEENEFIFPLLDRFEPELLDFDTEWIDEEE